MSTHVSVDLFPVGSLTNNGIFNYARMNANATELNTMFRYVRNVTDGMVADSRDINIYHNVQNTQQRYKIKTYLSLFVMLIIL